MNQQILHGFPDHRWRFIHRFTNDLYSNYVQQDSSGARITVGYLEDLVGELENFKPKRIHSGLGYKAWYGMICDGIHKEDVDMVRYSVAGMRIIVDQIFRKEMTWVIPEKRAA